MTLHENDTNDRENKCFSIYLSVNGLGKDQAQINNIQLSQAADCIITSIRGTRIPGDNVVWDNLIQCTVILRWMGY